ncbi:8474_t:CDS:2 [Scutellospora calospora]|uniref:8474_t:CDS:1 n=1 Tax=Scutellospora calospora TaxID=85575 RepID=A0ACA9K9J0_9GLOM|nr:8474_t:CDS:2 [Scutellospora calospora]
MNQSNLRIDVISDRRQRAIVNSRVFPKLSGPQFFKALCNLVYNDSFLNIDEKIYLIDDLSKISDIQNVSENIGEKRLCKYCNNKVIAILYCECCIRNYLKNQFNKWSSGNSKADKLIQSYQLSAISPSQIFEYIPYENFTNIKFIAKGGFSKIYSAIWENGPFTEWNIEQQELKRGVFSTWDS